MFDLIDDLSLDLWEDKGSPPDDLTTVPGYSDFVNCNILSRKASDTSKEIVYTVADDSGEHTRHILVKGLQAKDPLKSVRHFLALLEPIEGEENHFEAKALLLDMDWVVRK